MNSRSPDFDIRRIAQARREGNPDQVAEESLYGYFFPRTLNYLQQAGSRRPDLDLEIIASDVMIGLFSGLGRIRDPEHIERYLSRIARRTLQRATRQPRDVAIPLEDAPEAMNLVVEEEQEPFTQDFQLPRSLRKPLSILPDVNEGTARLLGATADLLIARRVLPESEKWERAKIDMTIIIGTSARYSNRQTAEYVAETTGAVIAEANVYTRMQRAQDLLDDNLFNPLGFVRLGSLRDVMPIPQIRRTSLVIVNFFDRPYLSVVDLGEAQVPSGLAEKARELVEGKKMPESIAAALKNEKPQLTNLIRLLR